jgi:hypothetical protein
MIYWVLVGYILFVVAVFAAVTLFTPTKETSCPTPQ